MIVRVIPVRKRTEARGWPMNDREHENLLSVQKQGDVLRILRGKVIFMIEEHGRVNS